MDIRITRMAAALKMVPGRTHLMDRLIMDRLLIALLVAPMATMAHLTTLHPGTTVLLLLLLLAMVTSLLRLLTMASDHLHLLDIMAGLRWIVPTTAMDLTTSILMTPTLK